LDPNSDPRWAEEDSVQFIEYGQAITPDRDEQAALISALIPAETDDHFVAVDIACGAGHLSAAILTRFPSCRLIALDGSRAMLEHAGGHLSRFGERVDFRTFDLMQPVWLNAIPPNIRCFVSSLAVHHLDGKEKQNLFRNLFTRLSHGGTLLIADLVNPVNERAGQAYGDIWDEVVRRQSMELTGRLEAYDRFRDGWNHYRTPDVEFDKPSGLFEQLRWLEAAGFQQVDCFWLRAGHAVYGGYKA
jgi:tRNA (cmo5U34)-methyltransferase